MKAVVAAFNQEKALVGDRGLLRDYEPSDGPFRSTSVLPAHAISAVSVDQNAG